MIDHGDRKVYDRMFMIEIKVELNRGVCLVNLDE
jgi:hypothetical protein